MSRYNDQLEDELDMANDKIASLRAENARLTQALAGARKEALEEAARIADANAHEDCDVAEQIATTIRALQEPAHD